MADQGVIEALLVVVDRITGADSDAALAVQLAACSALVNLALADCNQVSG